MNEVLDWLSALGVMIVAVGCIALFCRLLWVIGDHLWSEFIPLAWQSWAARRWRRLRGRARWGRQL
jgi:hypothetical protein